MVRTRRGAASTGSTQATTSCVRRLSPSSMRSRSRSASDAGVKSYRREVKTGGLQSAAVSDSGYKREDDSHEREGRDRRWLLRLPASRKAGPWIRFGGNDVTSVDLMRAMHL